MQNLESDGKTEESVLAMVLACAPNNIMNYRYSQNSEVNKYRPWGVLMWNLRSGNSAKQGPGTVCGAQRASESDSAVTNPLIILRLACKSLLY